MANMQNTSTTSSIRRNLRISAAIAAAAVLGGCSFIGGSDLSSVYEIARRSVTNTNKVSLKEAESVPYASVGVRVGSSNQIMLILAYQQGGQEVWTSASRIAITTKAGRIVRTAGLGRDLGGYASRQEARVPDGVSKLQWVVDLPDLGLYAIPLSCESRLVGEQTIEILEAKIRTRLVEEACVSESDTLDWSFKNKYWVDPDTALVWRSIQHTHPRLAPIELEVLRPTD